LFPGPSVFFAPVHPSILFSSSRPDPRRVRCSMRADADRWHPMMAPPALGRFRAKNRGLLNRGFRTNFESCLQPSTATPRLLPVRRRHGVVVNANASLRARYGKTEYQDSDEKVRRFRPNHGDGPLGYTLMLSQPIAGCGEQIGGGFSVRDSGVLQKLALAGAWRSAHSRRCSSSAFCDV
jgi:hypothetical protein